MDDEFRPWEGTFDDLSDRVYPAVARRRRRGLPTKAGLIAFAPGRKAQATPSRDDIDTKTLTAWMREADSEQAADGSWVYTDQP